MTQELRPFQIQLFRILLSLAALGTVFGVARRFDGFAAIITLFGLMIATLLFRRRWCDLASADGGILLGGGLMTLSSFFVLCYGPMGGAVRHAALLQNVTFTLGGMAWTLLLWPEMFGLTSMCLAFGVILAGRENVGFEPLRWRLLYLLLFAVSFVQVLLVFTHWPQISETPEFYIVVWQAGISVISLGLAVIALILWRGAVSRSATMHVILALLVFMYSGPVFHMYRSPVIDGETIANILSIYGPGFWLLLFGNTCVLCAACVTWMRTKNESKLGGKIKGVSDGL